MSTRMTVMHGDGFHLYAEVLDSKHVYLEVDGAEWVESHGSAFHRKWLKDQGKLVIPPPDMVLQIPVAVAERLFGSDLGIIGEGGLPVRDSTLGIDRG